jgi:hypothetical protein
MGFKQYGWYDHVRRINKERLVQKKSEILPILKKKRKKTSKFVDAEVTTGMREKGINNMEWIDRRKWRRKIKIWTRKDVTTWIP